MLCFVLFLREKKKFIPAFGTDNENEVAASALQLNGRVNQWEKRRDNGDGFGY